MTPATPFDDIRNLLADLPPANEVAGAQIRQRVATSPFGGVGELAEIAVWLARWSAKGPRIDKPMIAIFAGAHGINRQGVSTDTDSDVQALMDAIGAGQAPIARLCGSANIGLKVLDLAIDLPTADITQQDALEERDCAATMAFGMEAVAGGHDLLCLSGLGAGGDVVAAAILAALADEMADAWLAETGPSHLKLRAQQALEDVARRRVEVDDGLQIIGRSGGREIAAMAGAIVAASIERIPVVLDGLPALAAAAALHQVNPQAVAHCVLVAKPASAQLVELCKTLGLAYLPSTVAAAPGIGSVMAVGLARSAAWAA